jgi:Dual specificity phosphatase, catalytic domain
MIQILDGLFLGDRESARDREALTTAGVTHVVNCARELPCYFEGELTYLALLLRDPDPAFRSRLADACAFIDAGRRQGKVLVHCVAAVSRSPALVLAYLCHRGATLGEAAQQLARLVLTAPDEDLLWQLVEHLGLDWGDDDVERLLQVLLGRRAEW